ncbi:hypothetical protein SeLEV6574_g03292 [Synchytrium endobioticum]|nr:hypothetical protein SeLEV6574_g03292 [Synchytrium endobioticum]
MVKAVNINLVIFLAALIISIETAPEWDDHAIMEATAELLERARAVVRHRERDVNTLFQVDNPADVKSDIRKWITNAVSKAFPRSSPFTEQELLQELNESMLKPQLRFTRAYHSLVFEKLKTLFLKIQHIMKEQQNTERLNTGLICVAPHLLWRHDLERTWRERIKDLCSVSEPGFHRLREAILPEYDWEPVRNIVLPNLVDELARGQFPICNTKRILECYHMRVLSVIYHRMWIIAQGLPLNAQTDLNPTSYVVETIAKIRSGSRPFPFKEEQLLDNPNASMPPDQLQLTRAYHCVVFEDLKTFFETISFHFGAHENKEQFEQALAEVGRALQMHQNLESQYEEILESIENKGIVGHEMLTLPEYDWPRLDRIIRMQSAPEDQNYAYNYEPISDHGFGCGLEASTSQPRPQPVLIDFLGVKDMTREATPELAPRWGHSHDDRDPHTDNRFGNEQHRHPRDHVGLVGGSSMHPDASAGNIWRPCDSSLHGHQSTSNIGVADSPRPYTRFKMSGEYLDPT